jgi:DNA-binding transcriptional LysR family regulator
MNLQQLATFRMIASTGSFSRAAAALDYAQSTVTVHIQALESDLGTPLFDRLGRHVELTDAGHRLLAYSERLLDLAEETRLAVRGEQEVSGTLTIGAPETVCTYRLPRILRRYRSSAPGVRLIFRPLALGNMVSGVKDGSVDVTFVLEQPVKSRGLIVEPIVREQLVVVAAVDHPLAQLDQVSPTDLDGELLLLTEQGCGYRMMFERILREAGVFPGSNLEFNSIEAIKQLVIADVGIAILPGVAVTKELADGELAALNWAGQELAVYTQMVWHQDKWISPAMQTFIDLVRSQFQAEIQEAVRAAP